MIMNGTRYVFKVILVTLLSGCASAPITRGITIETEPPGAAIIVDGAYIGDSPVTTDLQPTNCVWVGIAYSRDGKRCAPVRVEAHPRGHHDGKLYSQSILVNPRSMISNKIFMNLSLEPIQPTQTINVNP